MDIFIPILICVLVFILLSVCGFCCKRKREGTVYGLPGTNVTVSTQPISASPVVVPPYPVEARHPTPHAGPPTTGFVTSNLPYPMQAPHPTPGIPYPPMTTTTPYPPAATTTPYPPTGPPSSSSAPYPDYSANPPSYSEAVSQPPVQPPPAIKEGYSKQSPYNPNY